ncbi:MAG: hypothetical protein A2Y02_00110 [Omnitrophica bacterium GWA2_52_12]|nr:MAG: hypothetical protein A2Y02_00110 [Omnitrophica bacterium GWA2_52_12]
MLTKKIEKTLNDQITLEVYSSNLYLAMGSWFETQRLSNSAQFFYRHSANEREHMMKLIAYVNREGGHARVPELSAPPASYKSLEAALELALENEKKVTKAIDAIVELCLETKDYGTFTFLQWYVAEQQEEEGYFRAIVDKIKMIGIKDSRGLFFADKAIGKLLETAPAKA